MTMQQCYDFQALNEMNKILIYQIFIIRSFLSFDNEVTCKYQIFVNC